MIKLNFRGDTIVEVLIAITVVSSVLGGAYVSANRSLKETRAAQERGEALKLTEAQLERIKSSAQIPGSAIFTTSAPYFCLNGNLQIVALTASDPYDLSASTYPADCRPSPQGGAIYYLSIQRKPGNIFAVRGLWDSATGKGIDQIEMVYRTYQ